MPPGDVTTAPPTTRPADRVEVGGPRRSPDDRAGASVVRSAARRGSPGRAGTVTAVVLATTMTVGCGGPPPTTAPPVTTASPAPSGTDAPVAAPESNPAGDIPDNQVYLPYPSPDGHFVISVPEGWARTSEGGGVRFTDKLNSVAIAAGDTAGPPTVDSVRTTELPLLSRDVPGYRPGAVSSVARRAGSAVLVTYEGNSIPDPVTGKTRVDAVERYEFWHRGRQVTVTLSGPRGADNVDPWRAITDSLQWR